MTLDWDRWRATYPTATYAQQQAFHADIYSQYPEQRHYSLQHTAQRQRPPPTLRSAHPHRLVLDADVERHGYQLTWAEDHDTDPSSGGHARACLYTKP